MTDRELLELAAKAAGVVGNYFSGSKTYSQGIWRNGENDDAICWNPLEDDGDAMRLAVRLHLWEAIRLAHRLVSDKVDIYAATRRAIVRDAAEIGKGMK